MFGFFSMITSQQWIHVRATTDHSVAIFYASLGTFDAIKKMIRYEGLKGFYKGMGTKIVQSVFAASVLFMVKEELVKALMFLADESQKILH